MQTELSLKEIKKEWHGTYKSYFVGLIISLLLTSFSFFVVIAKEITGTKLVFTVVGAALIQAICQLIFFLHLGKEPKPRWESVVFYFMVFILLIIVVGTLWIMYDLNDRTMSEMIHKNTP